MSDRWYRGLSEIREPTQVERIERALVFVLEGLAAVCAVFAFLAVIMADYWWGLGFAACAWAAFEASAELDG